MSVKGVSQKMWTGFLKARVQIPLQHYPHEWTLIVRKRVRMYGIIILNK